MATSGTITLSYSDVGYLLVGLAQSARAVEPPFNDAPLAPLPLISLADNAATYNAAVTAYADLLNRLTIFLGTLSPT